MQQRKCLPPLNALRAFEAAGRYASCVKAAHELCITPWAVAQQVAKLEDAIGVPLFEREKGKRELTPTGKALLQSLTFLFEQIGEAVEEAKLGGRKEGRPLQIAACIDICKWLVTRLKDFSRHHPDIRIAVCPLIGGETARQTDVVIACKSGPTSGLKLFDEILFPVCSPSLLAGLEEGRWQSLFENHPLVHDGDSLSPDGGVAGWEAWLEAAGLVVDEEALGGIVLSPSSLTIEAAIEGWGIALGRGVLINEELASGKLVRLSDVEVRTQRHYALQVTDRGIRHRSAAILQDWLVSSLRVESHKNYNEPLAENTLASNTAARAFNVNTKDPLYPAARHSAV
jgi:LysR family transcriptional regulator, glycine cleavage system transcriptional activator